MSYQIKFTAGENAGFCYPLNENQPLSIGRSHANDVCMKSPDVSGRHVIIRPGRGSAITVEVLSSRLTKYNDKQLNIGDVIDIFAGDRIQMGNESVFVLESVNNDDMQTKVSDDVATRVGDDVDTQVPDNEKTACPEKTESNQEKTKLCTVVQADDQSTIADVASASSMGNDGDKENQTVAFQTRIASAEELDEIKKAFNRRHYKKVFLIGLPIFIFFVAAITLYFYLKPETEEYSTWPTDKNGNFLNAYKVIVPYLAVCYPDIPGAQAQSKGDQLFVVSKIGKLRDVPLFIEISTSKNLGSLKIGHTEAFAAWTDAMKEKFPTMTFSGDKITVFMNANRGSGVPMTFRSYTRRKGNDDFYGYALFVRNGQSTHTCLIEVPFSSRWRADMLLRMQVPSMLLYAPIRTEEHWEGSSSYRKDSDVRQDLEEAFDLMEKEAPVYWGNIFYLLRSALIKATISNNVSQIAAAKKMLVKMREQQFTWYNTQKLAYQYAKRNSDISTMNSIQATCESVFSSEFQNADNRYDLVKRKDWK